MIEIRCNREQKDALKGALLNSDFCITCNSICEDSSCSECLEKNIKWLEDESTNSGLERLSGDFNRAYTKATQDIMKVFEYVNQDLNNHKAKMNYKIVEKILNCFLMNREKFRDDLGTSTGFIRVVRDEKGKWSNVEYFDKNNDLGE